MNGITNANENSNEDGNENTMNNPLNTANNGSVVDMSAVDADTTSTSAGTSAGTSGSSSTTPKKGLVLGGGGSRGSYEAGVMQALTDLGMQFDIVAGTSIGAFCGALYTSEDLDGLKKWIGSFKQDMVADNMFMFPDQYDSASMKGKPVNAFLELFTKGGPSIEPLKTRFLSFFDFDKFKNSPIDYGCVAFNVTQNEPAVFYKKDMSSAEDTADKLTASAAYFPAFNLVEIDNNYYLDGGYCNTVPVSVARDMGATDIIAVDISDPSIPSPVKDRDVMVIRPLLRLKYQLDFNGEDLLKQVNQGYLETLKYLGKAPGYLYTFYPDDWEHMQFLEKLAMEFLVGTGKIGLLEEMKPVMDEIYTFLLGYVPGELKNQYSEEYIFGRLLEVMGVIAGIDLYQQIHFKDFVRELLKRFNEFDSDPNSINPPELYGAMEQKGLKDFIVFFHTAIECYGMDLPKNLDVFKKGEYIFPYYIAFGWHLIQKFSFAFVL